MTAVISAEPATDAVGALVETKPNIRPHVSAVILASCSDRKLLRAEARILAEMHTESRDKIVRQWDVVRIAGCAAV